MIGIYVSTIMFPLYFIIAFLSVKCSKVYVNLVVFRSHPAVCCEALLTISWKVC